MDAFGKARRAHADDYIPTVKLLLLLGEYLSQEYRSHYYGKSQNLARDLTDEYDAALSEVDVLAMPTTPQTAYEVTDDLSRIELINRAFGMIDNTAPFDLTGHPALSVPCGLSDGLPVGLMFVGDRFDDKRVLEVGQTFESNHDWEGFTVTD